MKPNICYNCFHSRGEDTVCPNCGYVFGTHPQQPDMLEPGTILDKSYIVGTVIGRGGFGIIYKAFDMKLEKMVAIKENYPARMVNRGAGEKRVGICSGDREEEYKKRLARFMREARNMAVFSKEDDIVNVYQYFQENNTAYIVMEYVDGVLLKDYMAQKGRLDTEEAGRITVSILRALIKLHNKGVIHRDLSPDNIFLTEEGIKLIDFGAAAFLMDNDRGEGLEAVIKPGYAPPEQYASEYEAGTYMDVYSVGALLYQMITGEKPCEGSDRQSGFEELKKPSEYGITITKRFEKIILKAMAIRVEYRFQTAQEFRDALIKQTKVDDPEALDKKAVRKGTVTILLTSIIILSLLMGGLMYGLDRYSSARLGDLMDLEPGTLTVWLVADESRDESERIEHLKEQFQGSQISLDVREIAYDEYATELSKAKELGIMPDVFCTDYLNGYTNDCIPLTKLENTLSNMTEFDMLPHKGKGACCMPTGYRVALLFQDNEKCENQGIEIKEMIQPSDLKELEAKGIEIYDGIDRLADETDQLSGVLADSSYFDRIAELTLSATPAREISVSLVCDEEGEGLTEGCECYGVNKNSDENLQNAGMQCILSLMYQQLQMDTYMTGTYGIPMEKYAAMFYQDAHLSGYLDCIGKHMEQLKDPVVGKSIEDYYREMLP